MNRSLFGVLLEKLIAFAVPKKAVLAFLPFAAISLVFYECVVLGSLSLGDPDMFVLCVIKCAKWLNSV